MKSRPVLLLATLVPILAAYIILLRQTFPVPYEDDYHAILHFAAVYQQQPTWQQKILAIASEQHNEYKLVFEHSVVAAELQITRRLNFRFLSILGDLTLLPIAWLLWKTYADMGLRTFLPISFLFFALTYWETLNWAMTGLQNVPVILFSLLSLHLLCPARQSAPSRTRFVLACLAAALAAFTSANGFMLAPVGLLILLPRRAYARIVLWCLSFVVPLAAYLYHFVPVAHPAIPYANIARPLFFLALLGGIVPSPWLAVPLGLAVLATVLFALRSRFNRTHPVAVSFALWILTTAAVVAWVRGAAGLHVISRYSMYSILLLIFCYAFLTHHLATRSPTIRRAFYVTSVVLAIAFCFAADVHAWQKFAQRRRMVLDGIQLYRANPTVNSPLIDPQILRSAPLEQAYERDMLTEALEKGILTLACIDCRQQR